MTKLSKQISSQKDKLTMLMDKCDLSCKLKNIILYPANEIITSECCEIPQQKVEYIKTLINELIEYIESMGKVNEENLLHHLYILNFNTTALLSYICDMYKSFRADMQDAQLLLEHLHEFKHKINKIPQAKRPPFNVELRDLKEQVLCWINEEIALVKKELKRAKKNKTTQPLKLRFNYSVEVISGFYRLLYDAGLTSSGANQTIRWIANNISSKNQPNISPQSIQRRFFEKNISKEPLKEIVIHLLNHLNRK